VRGRQPSAVSLYLRGELFPTYHYTEMGEHRHSVDVDLTIPPHTHGVLSTTTPANGLTEPGGSDVTPTVSDILANLDRSVWPSALSATGPVGAAAALVSWAIDAADSNSDIVNLTVTPHFVLEANNGMNDTSIAGSRTVNMRITMNALDDHQHEIAPFPADNETQALPGGGEGFTEFKGVTAMGEPEYMPRRALPIMYPGNLLVLVDGEDLTESVRLQILNKSARAPAWVTLGDGSATHPLVEDGSGEIRIDFLPGVTLDEREHTIEIKLGAAGKGGRIHFNLYVE
jgi:hypothetical protein